MFGKKAHNPKGVRFFADGVRVFVHLLL